jgi:hypothetical protein
MTETLARAGALLPDLMPLAGRALDDVDAFIAAAKRRVLTIVAPDGAIDPARLETHQFAIQA